MTSSFYKLLIFDIKKDIEWFESKEKTSLITKIKMKKRCKFSIIF